MRRPLPVFVLKLVGAVGLATALSGPNILLPASALATQRGLAESRPQASLAKINLSPNETLVLPGYSPAEDSFRFSNRDLTQAIQANRDRSEWLNSFTLSLPELFGPEVCVGEDLGPDGKQCILTAAAQNWLASQMDLMEWGVCDAIAATSLFLRDAEAPPSLPWWRTLFENLIPNRQAQIAVDNDVLQTWVANQALLQGLDEVYLPTERIRETASPTEILGKIVEAFRSDPENPYTIGVYRRRGDQLIEGHSLLPYRVEAMGNSQYRVYVYDSNLPVESDDEPFILFDGEAGSWSYQPAEGPGYEGNAQSKNLDLTQLAWRRPDEVLPTSPPEASEVASQGPFACPFCAVNSQAQSLEISLVGEGQIAVERFNPLTEDYEPVGQDAGRVPFKGGLDRDVPASYVVSTEGSDYPFKVTVSSPDGQPQGDLSLQIIGQGYTAAFEQLRLGAGETLTLYVAATEQGPALTFEAQRQTGIPRLSIHLEDDFTESPATATEPEALADNVTRRIKTRYEKHVSYSFDISGISLPAGRSVGLAVDRELRRFYFADNDDAFKQYSLSVIGRNRDERVTETETRQDFPNGEFEITTLTERRTRRYEESLRISRVDVDDQLAYFDYGDWAEIPTADDELSRLLTDAVIPITYSPLPEQLNSDSGLLSLKPQVPDTTVRAYRGNLIKSNYR